MNNSTLYAEQGDLGHGSLGFHNKVTVLGDLQIGQLSRLPTSSSTIIDRNVVKIARAMLGKNNEFDCAFVVNDREIALHRQIVRGQSEVLETMFLKNDFHDSAQGRVSQFGENIFAKQNSF